VNNETKMLQKGTIASPFVIILRNLLESTGQQQEKRS